MSDHKDAKKNSGGVWNPEKPWLPDPAQFQGTWRDDWRIMGQEGYLLNCRLQHRTYSRALCRADFLQCEFCWDKFDEDPQHPKKAYFEPKGQYWICEKCYEDFKDMFEWTVQE